MFDTQDISLLRQLLLEQEVKLLSAMQQNSETLRTELRSELRSDIRASADDLRDELGARIQKTETNLREEIQSSADGLRKEFSVAIRQSADDVKREIRDEMRSFIVASEKRIIESVADFVDSSVISQISALQQDVIRIKQHVQLV